VKVETAILSDSSNNLSIAATSTSIVRDNIPPGHTWTIEPLVNNTTKEVTFTPSYTANSTIELRGNGIRWSGKIDLTYSERNY
jgi:methionine aminopeptidase